MKDSKFNYISTEFDKELPIKELLKRRFGFSSRLLTKLKVHGGVMLNGKPVKMYIKPEPGSRISVSFPQEKSDFEAENIPISAVYEDNDLIFINKQPGYVVHPTKGHPCHTIANGLMAHMKRGGTSYKIRFVNRLDMDTSGLLIIAKNSHSQDELTKQMMNNLVQKKYVAVIKGIIEKDEGTIDLPIGRIQEEHIKRTVQENGLPSVTHYKVRERYKKGFTLIELSLETGRTHQIRVHMSHIGHPIVADVLYGTPEVWLIERQALHAEYLSFSHPITGVPMELTAPLPQDMLELIEKIK